MERKTMLRSPQEVDPLSWFTRPFLPLTFAVAMVVAGAVFVLGTLKENTNPALQCVAIACFVLACLTIHRGAGPKLTTFRVWHAIFPLALSWVGVAVSAVGASGGTGEVSHWWAPLGVAIVLAALAPFSSALLLIGYGLLGTAVCGFIAAITFHPSSGTSAWPPLTIVTMAAIAPLQATVATATFSAFMVDRVTRWSDLPIQAALTKNPVLDFSQWNAQRGDLRPLSERVMPFIEQIAKEGFVTARDRTVAAGLAKEVRDELVQAIDRSWLESLAAGSRFRVVDPSHRAGQLTRAQRGALRSLIVALLDSPALVSDSLGIELRDSEDGTVAVALSMKLDLAEGKRVMMLAPYYLSLKATVDNLIWEGREQLHLRFRVPAPEAETPRS